MSFGRAWRQILISKERKGKRKRTIELKNVTRRTKEHYRKPLVSQGFLKEKEVSDKEKSLKFKRLEGKPTKNRGINISSCFWCYSMGWVFALMVFGVLGFGRLAFCTVGKGGRARPLHSWGPVQFSYWGSSSSFFWVLGGRSVVVSWRGEVVSSIVPLLGCVVRSILHGERGWGGGRDRFKHSCGAPTDVGMFVIWGALENACMLAIFHYDFSVLLIVSIRFLDFLDTFYSYRTNHCFA